MACVEFPRMRFVRKSLSGEEERTASASTKARMLLEARRKGPIRFGAIQLMEPSKRFLDTRRSPTNLARKICRGLGIPESVEFYVAG